MIQTYTLTLDGTPIPSMAAGGVAVSFLTNQTIVLDASFAIEQNDQAVSLIQRIILGEPSPAPAGTAVQPGTAASSGGGVAGTIAAGIGMVVTAFTSNTNLNIVAFDEKIMPYADGTHRVTITPSQLSGYTRPVSGANAPNKPLFLCVGMMPFHSSDPGVAALFLPPLALGPATLGHLMIAMFGGLFVQDPIDVVRQEYVDFGTVAPPIAGLLTPQRSDLIAAPPGDPFNVGNYTYRLGPSLKVTHDAILAAYRGATVVDSNGAPILSGGSPVTIDLNARIDITSAYRNPRRNVLAGSQFALKSKHVWGRALDVAPVQGTLAVSSAGAQVPLALHTHLYPTLLAATKTVVANAIAEKDATPVPVGNPTENHLHCQW